MTLEDKLLEAAVPGAAAGLHVAKLIATTVAGYYHELVSQDVPEDYAAAFTHAYQTEMLQATYDRSKKESDD